MPNTPCEHDCDDCKNVSRDDEKRYWSCIICGKEYKSVDNNKALVKKLTEVIEDFLPNIGSCVLQDYGRLNEALAESREFLK